MAEKKEYVSPYIEIVPGEEDGGARYRLPYGIASGMGLDTTGMTPREVWDILKGHGISPDNAYKELEKKAKQQINKQEIVEVKPIKNDYLRKTMQVNKVNYVPIRKLNKELNEQEIIDKVGGIDKTKGSCASLALTYFGNRAGMDILDMRGGSSAASISRVGSIKQIANMEGVKSFIQEDYNDFNSAKKVLQNVKEGKEYYFGCGAHGAVVRKINGELQYLELQMGKENGFKKLTKEELKKRFKAKQSNVFAGIKIAYPSILIDGESFSKCSDFINLLPYINTKKY
jgi:hypothetical protein